MQSRRRIISLHAWRTLWSQKSTAALQLLFVSGFVAVVAVTTILSLTSFMKATLLDSSTELLAGDRQLVSPRPIDKEWQEKLDELDLTVSLAVEFRSMLFSEAGGQLVTVKAVDDLYPLKGDLTLEISDQTLNRSLRETDGFFIQKRLFSLLGVDESGQVAVGDFKASVQGVLKQEPDVGFGLAGIQPRVLMHRSKLDETNVLQPGSRSKWRYYIAGEDEQLLVFDEWIESRLNSSQSYEGVEGGRPAIASALEKAESYLLLASSLAVLLACLAIALCARQYAAEQVESVAVLKTLGFDASDISRMYRFVLFCVSAVVLVTGVLASQLLAVQMLELVKPLFDNVEFATQYVLMPEAVVISTAITLLCIFGFAWPSIARLRGVTPIAVLRPESGSLEQPGPLLYMPVILAILGCLYLFTESYKMILLFALVGGLLIGVIALVLFILFSLARRGVKGGIVGHSAIGMAVTSLLSSRRQTMVQACIYAFAISLAAIIFLVRNSLIDDWQAQLPDDAPNHFMINVREHQLEGLRELLGESGVDIGQLYPMVRGRLSHINGEDVRVAVTKDVAALNRELNLSWTAELPDDNEIVKGQWWGSLPPDPGSDSLGPGRAERLPLVSVERDLALNIGLEVGDLLGFTFGPDRIEARVNSIRTVQWDSMRPNFYVFFEPGALDEFPNTYISSFYLAEDQKNVINTLTKAFPTVSVLELDNLIVKIRGIVQQVTSMLELVLLLIFGAALLVVAAITSSRLQERLHEASVMRAFGIKSSSLRKSYFVEFFLLGVFSTFASLIVAELALNTVTGLILGGEARVHAEIWIYFPVSAGVILGVLGASVLRSALKQPPMVILR
jgi:putative ABC transport system permease protein